MRNKLEQMSQLFMETKEDVTKNISNYKAYLTTASRLYKYNFDEQIAIFAQRPTATACATMELWNGKMNRWVKSGAKGIALIKHSTGQKPRLEYLFDIEDTRRVQGARDPYLWNMKESYHTPILEKMTERYGTIDKADFAENLMEFSARAVGEHYREFLHDLTYDLEDSFLEELDTLNVDVNFRNALTVSVQYAVLTRCGIDADAYLEDSDFASVLDFNTPEVLSHLGNALSLVSKEMLLQIGDIARNIDRELMKNPLAKASDVQYNKNINFNTLKQESENVKGAMSHEQSNISEEWGLPNSDLDTGARELSRNSGQVWDAERNTPQRTQEWDLQSNATRRESVATPLPSGRTSTGTGGLDNERTDESTKRERSTERNQSDVMGTDGNQHQSTSRGSRTKRDDLLLDFVTTEEHSEEYLAAILSHDTHFKSKLEEISAYFSAHFDPADRADYMERIINKEYTEIAHDDIRLGYKSAIDGLTIWKGSYLSRISESKLSWDLVQGFTNNLVLPAFRQKQAEKPMQISMFPTVEQQIEHIVEAKAVEQTTAFSFAQTTLDATTTIPLDVIDKVLTSGSNELTKFNQLITAGHFAYTTDLQDNAKFLQKHYRTGGKGFVIDGQKYAVWFDKTGLQIARGNEVRIATSKVTLSWEQVAEKIRGLLEDGRFVPTEILDKSREAYMHHVAETYSFMYRDRSDDYTNEKLDAIVTRFGYPDCLYEISKHFQDSDKFANMMAGVKQMIQDHENTEGGIMRMGRMRLREMPHIIQDMNREPIVFPPPQANFRVTNPSFITNDEITAKIASGSGVSDGKLRIYSFFKENHTDKEKVDFLKYEHSGSVYGNKGIVIERDVDFNRYDEITISFPKCVKMINQLIKENRYLTQEEFAELPRFEKRQLGAAIANFYSYAPSDLERPFDDTISYYWDKADSIGEQLENPAFVEKVLLQMDYALKNTLSDERGFDSMQKAFDGLTAYQNGTYTVYPSKTPTQPTTQKKEKAVDENDITRLASNLERKRKTALKSDEYGQLTLDFSAPTPVTNMLEEKGFVVSDELIDFAKETLDDTATPNEIADKVVEIIAQDEYEQNDIATPPESVLADVSKVTQEQTITSQEKLIQGEQSVLAFLAEKAEHPNMVVGVAAGELLLFYGKDAEQVAPILGSKLLQREVPELGNSYITGTNIADWRVASAKLSQKGVDFCFLAEENNQHYMLTEQKASDYIPLGSQVQYEGKSYTIEEVNYQEDTVYLRDVHGTLPVMQMVDVSHAHDLVAEQQLLAPMQLEQVEEPRYSIEFIEEAMDHAYYVRDKEFDYDGWEKHQYPDLIYQAYPTKEEAEKAIDTLIAMEQAPATPDILFFDDFKDISIDYSKYNDQDVIGYNKDGVKYTVGKSGNLTYTTTTTSITPYGEVLGDSMTPEIYEKFKAWKSEKDRVALDFDGGSIVPTDVSSMDAVEMSPVMENAPKINFRITDDTLGVGSLKEKFARNITAIQTLKSIESQQRQATPEEQQILSQYVGFGGLPDAFDESKTAWASEFTQLRGLLTDDEYEKARASTLNAHFTSPVVIRSMYDALEKMGVPTDGNLLDPALGSGNFFGMLPETMANAKLYGSELDSLTGRIASQLYPNADVHIKGYEKTDFPDNFFDIALGNVPFGNYQLADKRYDKHKFLIHDYFFSKTLDKVRTGGIVAFITSKGTLDKENTAVREYLAQRADLLGAIRLPNTAFKANAGTEVTSDILFLQKRDHAPEVLPNWVNLGETEDGVTVNQYFAENPQMIMGEMAMVSGPFGMESTCNPNMETSLAQQLQVAIQHITMPDQTLLQQQEHKEDANLDTSIAASPDVRNFSYTMVDNQIYFRENSRMNPVQLSDKAFVQMKDLIALRDKTREIIEMQLDECSDEQLSQAQAELNTLYDSYNKKHGLINSNSSKRAFTSDVSYPLLCSLEKLDEEGKLKGKADMFTKRTIKNSAKITSVDTPTEALAVSISEKACVDVGFMAGLLGGSEKIPDVIDGLKGIIFKDPLTHTEGNLVGWLPSDEYLSGNVREKLEIAKAVAQTDPEYAINVEMLQKVQPKELSASEIDVRIGATWIDPKYYAQFMFELLGTPRYMQGDKIDINYSKHTGEWNVRGKSEDRANPKSNATYGTKRKNAYAIMEDSLNLRDTRIYDKVYDDEGREKRVLNPQQTTIAQQKQEAIGEAFKEWIWKTPERREELTKVYNAVYNSTRPREFDGGHIKFDGMSPLITLNAHQKNAVARTLYGGNTLLAHCVGAGKTFTMIAGAMEGKRLGLHQKSLFVVPNHLTEQMGADIYQLYPGAKVLVATKKDFEPANRKTFCSRIATGDFDIVVIGHSQFEKIPLSVVRQEAILKKQISDILLAIEDAKAQNGERYTVKQLEKTKKSLETRLEKLATQERKDNVITFEELGVDKLFVDEGHLFKNLFLHTKMRNVAGIGQSEAQKSTDMFTKCRYMDELTGGKGVVFATGTPVSNSMTELYTMMRYLQYATLEKLDLTHFDSWAANFGEKITAIELAPEGTGFRAKTRFAKFFNLPELINIWKEASDIQTADMLKLPVPVAEQITVVTKPSEFQREMVENLAERADSVRKKEVEPNVDNMLKITSDGRKLALDQRLGNDMLADHEESKINACVGNVFDIWEESTDTLGTQIIFCDLSTPHYDGTFNVYDDIKNKLIEKGVPPDEIKFIHDANTEQQKAELFAKVRKGTVRVLIGSTAKCGAGTNIQTKLVALHHTDCPWRPADLEQREGRIVRQGNENSHVKIFKYVTENTFDAYNWSLIENKQRFIGQIFTSKSPARSADDIDATALSYAEVKALATGDERIKEKMDLDVQVAKLKLMRSSHQSNCYEMEDRAIKFYPVEIKKTEERIAGLKADLATADAHPLTRSVTMQNDDGTVGAVTQEDAFEMVIGGVTHTERKTAGEAIIEACKQIKNPDDRVDLGTFRGLPMRLYIDGGKFHVALKGATTHDTELENSVTGNISRIANLLDAIPKKVANLEERLHTLKDELESAKTESARPFPKEDEYKEKSKRLAQLNIELDNTSKDNREDKEVSDDAVEPTRPSVLEKLHQPKQAEKAIPFRSEPSHDKTPDVR